MEPDRLCDLQLNYIKSKIEYYSFQLATFWKITLLVLVGAGAAFFFVKTVLAFAKLLFYALILFVLVYVFVSVLVMNSYSAKIRKAQKAMKKIYADHIASARLAR